MKKYPFCFSYKILAIILGIILFSLAGIGWNIYAIISLQGFALGKIISAAVLLAVCLLLLLFCISLLLNSAYYVKGDYLVLRFGVIVNSYDLKGLKGITLARKKLTVKKDGKTEEKEVKTLMLSLEDAKKQIKSYNVMIKEEYFGEFIDNIQSVNSFVLVEEKNDDEIVK